MRNWLLILILLGSQVQAGVIIGGTRVVYGEKNSSVTLALRNNSPTTWLINSKIAIGGSWPGSHASVEKAPFVIAPPLFVLKAGRESTVRIIFTGPRLPGDRESLFTLSIATIPSGQVKDNSVQLAVRSQLKLFYRPAELPGLAQDAYRQLRWSRAGNQLRVENPTPYYVTIFSLQINGQKIRNAGMVAPFSFRHIRGCPQLKPCSLRWQGINDYGRVMPAMSLDNIMTHG